MGRWIALRRYMLFRRTRSDLLRPTVLVSGFSPPELTSPARSTELRTGASWSWAAWLAIEDAVGICAGWAFRSHQECALGKDTKQGQSYLAHSPKCDCWRCRTSSVGKISSTKNFVVSITALFVSSRHAKTTPHFPFLSKFFVRRDAALQKLEVPADNVRNRRAARSLINNVPSCSYVARWLRERRARRMPIRPTHPCCRAAPHQDLFRP